jgi:hypothetical protein
MTRDFAHRFSEQFFSGRKFGPGRGAGRMWQRDQVETVAGAAAAEFATNHLREICAFDELRDGEAANWNDKSRLQNADFLLDPRRAISNFIRRRNTIAAAGGFAGETSTNSGKIDCRSYRWLAHSAELLEPAKHCSAGGVRERSLQDRLARPGCLANEHDGTEDRAA